MPGAVLRGGDFRLNLAVDEALLVVQAFRPDEPPGHRGTHRRGLAGVVADRAAQDNRGNPVELDHLGEGFGGRSGRIQQPERAQRFDDPWPHVRLAGQAGGEGVIADRHPLLAQHVPLGVEQQEEVVVLVPDRVRIQVAAEELFGIAPLDERQRIVR
ncbi:hypothetical protein D9M68_568350 [compost metagenome]